jgi:hypothetical protein
MAVPEIMEKFTVCMSLALIFIKYVHVFSKFFNDFSEKPLHDAIFDTISSEIVTLRHATS